MRSFLLSFFSMIVFSSFTLHEIGVVDVIEPDMARHEEYIVEYLEDIPEIRGWQLGKFAEQDALIEADDAQRAKEARRRAAFADGHAAKDRALGLS